MLSSVGLSTGKRKIGSWAQAFVSYHSNTYLIQIYVKMIQGQKYFHCDLAVFPTLHTTYHHTTCPYKLSPGSFKTGVFSFNLVFVC